MGIHCPYVFFLFSSFGGEVLCCFSNTGLATVLLGLNAVAPCLDDTPAVAPCLGDTPLGTSGTSCDCCIERKTRLTSFNEMLFTPIHYTLPTNSQFNISIQQ